MKMRINEQILRETGLLLLRNCLLNQSEAKNELKSKFCYVFTEKKKPIKTKKSQKKGQKRPKKSQ